MTPAAIITGAGRGIGRATALALAARGFRLALLARSADELTETARLAGGGEVVPVDVADATALDAAVTDAIARLGGCGVLVNNAGYAPSFSIADLPPAEWRRIMDVNTTAVVVAASAAWPALRAGGGGAIVSVSSVAARDPFPGLGAYGAAKAAVNQLTLAMAREGAADNIRAYAVAPGAVETAMLRGLFSADMLPPADTLDPADVAAVIADCVTGSLRHASGETIYVRRRP